MAGTALTAGLVLAGLIPAAPAAAQAPASQPAPQTGDDLLGEVVVTATRQADTVNRVPLSISAVGQQSLDQQGIKDVQDLARNVPGVNFRRSGGEQNPSISIRGIVSTLGSPTTGVYLDDVPIQKRDTNGASTGNGTPFPQLFDLDRVEILRGPQGTLYGGSAQGGAVRFITPTPSLTRYGAYARTELSQVKGGGTSYEVGVAVGGPIIRDKLAFRAAGWGRRTGGYLDHVSLFTGEEFGKDTNWREAMSGRFTLLWQPTENVRVQPAVYFGDDQFNDTDTFQENIPQIRFNSGVFTNRGTTGSGVRFDFPDTVFTGGVYGPFNHLGPTKSYDGYYPDMTRKPTLLTSGRHSKVQVWSLNLEYDLPDVVNVKSITGYTRDVTTAPGIQGLAGHRNTVFYNSTNAQFISPTSVVPCTGAFSGSQRDDGTCGTPIAGGVGNTLIFIPGFTQRYRQMPVLFARNGITQEFRVSTPADRRFSVIAGAFYSNQRYRQQLREPGNEVQAAMFLRGVGEEWFMGQTNSDVNGQPLPVGTSGFHAFRNQFTREREKAVFGEANLMIFEGLKATAGVRLSEVTVTYLQQTGASVFANPTGFVGSPAPPAIITDPTQGHPFANQPGDPIFTITQGEQKEKPVSPKFGLSYQIDERNLVYATFSSGYRSGGVNQPVSPSNCAAYLATAPAPPLSFKSDKVNSYEAGAKLRLLEGVQVNSSLFYIKWKDPQIGQRIASCGHSYVDNGGSARSQGFDVQAQARFGGLTFGGAVAYTDATYTETVTTPPQPGTTPQVIVRDGDELGAPKWQVNANVQYDIDIGQHSAYIRADYQYTGHYKRSSGPGTISYSPIPYRGAPLTVVNARIGLRLSQGAEVSVFANNLFDESSRVNVGNTPPSLAVTGTILRPREIGVQATMRY